MASPHVAAVAALLYSQGITNPAAIEAAIKRFARDLGAPGRDDEFGYGLIDARASLRGFGVGR
jgi:serine protease